MLPGPVIIKKCSLCNGMIKEKTIASGNTRGAKRWTDGEFRARMLPISPSLIKCGHCNGIAWRTEFTEADSFDNYLGFLAFSEKDEDKKRIADAKLKRSKYENLPFFEEPCSEEIIGFIASNNITNEQELYARARAWRKWNDSRREDDSIKPLSSHEIKNLEDFIRLLVKSNGSKLLLAEAYRELGELVKAKNILMTNTFSEDEESVVQVLLELIESGDTQVCLITEDDEREWRMLRRLKLRNDPSPSLPAYDASGPPVFPINSKEWWFKPVEMLVHNWALIEINENDTAIVYFFHDKGIAKNVSRNFKLFQLKGRCAIVDSFAFENIDAAEFALQYNGFKQLKKNAGPWDGDEPFGTFYDARSSEDGVYSKLGYWKTIS